MFTSIFSYLVMIGMVLTSLLLILLVLVQRGRGGGLAGAFGGMGGQSAFGTKAGDVFTRITAAVAVVWFILCIGAIKIYSLNSGEFESSGAGFSATQPLDPAAPLGEAPEGGTPAATPDGAGAPAEPGTPPAGEPDASPPTDSPDE